MKAVYYVQVRCTMEGTVRVEGAEDGLDAITKAAKIVESEPDRLLPKQLNCTVMEVLHEG